MALSTFDGRRVSKPFSWSFSSLNNYRTCPKRYGHYNVIKDVKEQENDNMRWGNYVHDRMAKRLAHAQPLPKEMAAYEKWADWALVNTDRTVVDFSVERKLAMTANFEPCEYFDKVKPVWFRTVIDVLKVRPSAGVARIIDWKTGKVPDDALKEAEAMQQLALSASVVFAMYPQVHTILAQLAYLAEDVKNEETITRDDLKVLWRQVNPILDDMRSAFETMEYPPKRSGLCRRHCGVTSCAFHGKGMNE